jgi:hypothetical protein
VTWSPVGDWVATAGEDGTTRLFNPAVEALLQLAHAQRDIGLTPPEREVCLGLVTPSAAVH